MSTAAVSTLQPSTYTSYLQQRQSDLQQLGQDLQAGDLTDAQTEYNTIQSLGQNGPFNGDAFSLSDRQQDFNALGQEIQSGNLTGAQQAFAQLANTFRHQQVPPPASAAASTSGTSGTSASGPEIVLNLGNAPAGEQITINVNNTSNGTDQVTVGVAGQQGQNPEQIALNLNQNSNQEIVLNLFNSASGSQAQGSNGVSVSA
jgi:hypothetical protein